MEGAEVKSQCCQPLGLPSWHLNSCSTSISGHASIFVRLDEALKGDLNFSPCFTEYLI